MTETEDAGLGLGVVGGGHGDQYTKHRTMNCNRCFSKGLEMQQEGRKEVGFLKLKLADVG